MASLNLPPDWEKRDQAHRERRTFALVCFDAGVKFESVVKPGEPLPEGGLFVSCAGGTEIAVAVARGLELIASNQGRLNKADLVLVTDGGSDTASAATLRDGARPGPGGWARPGA